MSTRVVVDSKLEQVAPAPWRIVHTGVKDRRSGDRRMLTSMAQSETEAERVEDARRRGFAEGVAAAKAKAEADVAAIIERFGAEIVQLVQYRDQIRAEATSELVRLAILIASRVLHRELTVDPEAILGLVKAAVEKAGSREIHRVKLHASHEAQVRKVVEQLSPQRTIEIVADPGLKPGDVLFETSQGELDASVSTQLREIERGLADRLKV